MSKRSNRGRILVGSVSLLLACATNKSDQLPAGASTAAVSPTSSGSESANTAGGLPELPLPRDSCARTTVARFTAPAGLNPALAHATNVLLALGLVDPRGLAPVSARAFAGRFAGRDVSQQAVGWLVPASEGRAPMLLSLRGDLLEIDGATSPLQSVAASPSARAQTWREAREARAIGSLQYGFVSAVLLAARGDVGAANEQWRAAPALGTDAQRSAMNEFAELYFDSSLAAYRAGRYGTALEMTRVLECARPYIEEHGNMLSAITTFHGGRPHMEQERATAYLAGVPALVDELRRRASSPSAALEDSQVDAASDAALIAALDRVALGNGDGADAETEGEDAEADPRTRVPALRALRSRGAAVVSTLIDALERDARWTLTIEHQAYPLARRAIPVRELLAWAISANSGMYPAEFGWSSFYDDEEARPAETARALRERWNAIRTLSPFDRAMQALDDSSSNFSRQIFSVAQLFSPGPAQRDVAVLVRGRGPRILDRMAAEGPSLTDAQRERLVQALRRRAPGLGPMRDRSPGTLDEEDRRCGYSQAMFTVSPTLARSFVRDTLDRLYARDPDTITTSCSAWLTAALATQGDRDVVADLVRRVRTLRPGDGELRGLASWWGSLTHHADAQPFWEALAANIGTVREWPVQTEAGRSETFVAPGALSVISRTSIRARPLREVVLRLLDETRTNAMVRFERGRSDVDYLNPRGMRTLSLRSLPEGPDFVAPGTMSRLRLSDAVAGYLADYRVLENGPTFDVRWTQARRDRAIAEYKRLLAASP